MYSITSRIPSFFVCLSIALVVSDKAQAEITLNEIDLANNKVEVTNTGGSSIDISGWWYCNRVNGSPFYSQLGTSLTIDTSLSSEGVGASLTSVDPGEILVLDVPATALPDVNGEFSFYNTNSFGSAAAIEDYVLWGANGIRDIVAQNAGIWTDNDFIDISGIGPGETLQLSPGLPGDDESEYIIATGTIGSANVPEPATACCFLISTSMVLLRRSRR